MTLLRSVAVLPTVRERKGYPFDLPLIQSLPELDVSVPVTFLVGENGSGKSTLLEAIGASVGSVTIGGAPIAADPRLAPARRLADCLRLTWSRKTRLGFYMRAEDFITWTDRSVELLGELDDLAEEARTNRDTGGGDWWRAEAVARGERALLQRGLGAEFDARSHGESFLDMFGQRLRPGGLHLLDEPETPLSPLRQLALLALIRDTANEGGQFIVATHAPILLACPGATILQIDGDRLAPVAYDDVPNVRLMRDFLADPAAYLRYL
ncbi:MAG TPA: AAA family ATPase [Thermomicrobiales bacterium]|jgi:predicted ATPase|nr:AAA family ATPase [Thermomicrobiales bacterium]